jgi:DNA uptake protein ComE-like DNA-binding protein
MSKTYNIKLLTQWTPHKYGDLLTIGEEDYQLLSRFGACELLNEAKPLVVVPSEEAKPELVNLNTATSEALNDLPEFGPATVRNLIAGRPYATLDAAKTASKMPSASWDAIVNLVTI